jgi:hypothetical protein
MEVEIAITCCSRVSDGSLRSKVKLEKTILKDYPPPESGLTGPERSAPSAVKEGGSGWFGKR